MLEILSKLAEKNMISQGDYYFAKLIADKQSQEHYPDSVKNLAILLVALCSWRYTKGDTCCYLTHDLDLFGLAYQTTEAGILAEIREKTGNLPVEQWQSRLRKILFSTLHLWRFNLVRCIFIVHG